MKKILIIHHVGNIGGGTLSCFDVITALKTREFNIILALPPGENLAKNKAKEMNIEILEGAPPPVVFSYYNGSTNTLKAIIKILLNYKYKKKWEVILEKENPDLVILNSVVQWPLISVLNKNNIKTVCFVRETMKGNPNIFFNRIIKKRLSSATGVSFLSGYDLKQWNLPNSVNKIIIPDLVDIEEFKINTSKEMCRVKLSLKNDVFYILYVGGMNKLKGANLIIKAMKELAGQKIELLFLGDLGDDLIKSRGFSKVKNYSRIKFINKINDFISKNNMKNSVKFIGLQEDMKYWYAACDLVVFPAEKAHQARPIYEAGVFKKTVVVPNFPNFNEYLKPGVSGLVYEPGNYKELANIIKRLYSDQKLCSHLGNNNYELTNELHDAKKINIKVKKYIQSLFEGN